MTNLSPPKIEVDLSGLKDIHIPLEPHWWPLPIGWWIVISAVIFCIFIAVCFFLYWYTRPKQYALRELKTYYRQEKNPILLEILPLGLEEIFVYEMEALGYDFANVLR